VLTKEKTMTREQRRRHSPPGGWMPGWFKACLVVLAVLILLRILQLQVFIEVSLDGIPYLTGLTELETYLIPLGLLLLYILGSWIWKRVFGSRDMHD